MITQRLLRVTVYGRSIFASHINYDDGVIEKLCTRMPCGHPKHTANTSTHCVLQDVRYNFDSENSTRKIVTVLTLEFVNITAQ